MPSRWEFPFFRACGMPLSVNFQCGYSSLSISPSLLWCATHLSCSPLRRSPRWDGPVRFPGVSPVLSILPILLPASWVFPPPAAASWIIIGSIYAPHCCSLQYDPSARAASAIAPASVWKGLGFCRWAGLSVLPCVARAGRGGCWMFLPVAGGGGLFGIFGNRGGRGAWGGWWNFWRGWFGPLRRCSPATTATPRRLLRSLEYYKKFFSEIIIPINNAFPFPNKSLSSFTSVLSQSLS